MNNLKSWLHGLLAAAISAFATSATGFIALPTVFSLTRDGFANMFKMSVPPMMVAVFLYLKQSPLPGLTVTAPANIKVDSGTVAVSANPEATIEVQEKKL